MHNRNHSLATCICICPKLHNKVAIEINTANPLSTGIPKIDSKIDTGNIETANIIPFKKSRKQNKKLQIKQHLKKTDKHKPCLHKGLHARSHI